MKLAIIQPDYASKLWADIPVTHRTEIRALLALFEDAPDKGLTKWLKSVAKSQGLSYGALRAKYYALRNNGGDWSVLIDSRKTGPDADEATTREPRFVEYVLTLVEDYQRKNAPAFRELRRRWLRRDKLIPGYESWPNWPQIPLGWSNRNLAEIVQKATNKAAMRSIRVGTSSKTNPFLPHVITTRVGLWPGAILQFDDMRHNFHTTVGRKRELVLVNELGVTDLYSADRFHWGAKPQRTRANGTRENLALRDMRSFVAGAFHRFGYSPFGCMCMSEHNTAKIEEFIARLLYDATGGMIRVDYQPIEGKQAALTGFWAGSEGGNFRAKALLESLHNLIQNDTAHIAMQTGSHSSGLKGPVTTERMVAYIGRILKTVAEKVPHRMDLLRLPAWDFHTQLLPFLVDYYEIGLAMRTDHDLEGWKALGHEVTEYTMLPGSDQWFSEETFLKLPDVSQLALREAARTDPRRWTNRRYLSPREVFNRRGQWLPLPPTVICDMIGEDMAREVVARRGYVEFADEEISLDPLIYKARYVAGPRKGQEIGHGEKVQMFIFPFDDTQTAIVVDAKRRYLGELPLAKRVLPINPDAFGSTAPFESRPEIRSEELKQAAGEKHSRIADILEPVRVRHAEQVQDAREMRDANNRIANPNTPVTPDEIAEHRSAIGHKAAASRLRNKVTGHAASIDTAGVLEAWTTPEAATPDLEEAAGEEPFNPFV